MKINKLFLRLITVFGITVIFAISGWGVCPTGSSIGTWTASAGSTYNNHTGDVQSDDADYYTITNPVGGQINLSIQNTPDTNNNLYATLYSDSTCSTAVWSSGEIGDLQTSTTTVSVTAGTTYYLYLLGSKSNGDTKYLLNANKPIKGHDIYHENPFTPVFANGGLKLFGDFTSTGSSVLCQNNGSGGCNNNYNGYLYDSNLVYKNEGAMTLNSASSLLTLPADVDGGEIQWAGLYWQGHIADPDAGDYTTSTMVQNRQNVSFRLPDGTTQDITADDLWYHDFWGDGAGNDGGFRSFYQGYKDVTALVKSHLVSGTSQTFTVGNIKANSGTDWYSYLYVGPGAEYDGIKFGFWGNWSLIVVYKYDQETMPADTKLKNINVFNGFDAMIPLPISGYETSSVEIPISGFLTPKSGSVNAKMLFYASGGEKLISRDAFYIQNANNANTYEAVSNAVNPINNPFNGSVSNDGVPVDAAISYYPGLDLDSYNVSSYMKNSQTSTSLKLEATFSSGNGDQSTPGAIAFSSDLYTPSFCYDYGYEQNGLSFTEENSGNMMPYIRGYLSNTEDINVSLFIKNRENSDVSANNVILDISDINSSQAIYKRNSVSITYPNVFVPISKTDAGWPLSVGDTYINDIPLGNMAGKQYSYTYYTLSPQKDGNISIPIVGTFSYDLVIPLADGTTLTIPSTSSVGGVGLPMCSSDNFSYNIEKGIFSVVDAGLYDTTTNVNNTTGKKYYDLTTQVSKRPGNFRIASFDPNDPNFDLPKAVRTAVAVEMIDVSQFHDTDAACREPSSAITPRVWVNFKNSATDGNTTQVDFNAQTIQDALDAGMVSDTISSGVTTLTNPEDFFKNATPNAAFRVTFNVTNDGNNSLIQTAEGSSSENTQILNFTQLVQDIQHCAKPVEIPSNPGSTTSLVAVACGNAGNQGIDQHNLAICMECLYGYNTQVLCSRDNFAIRPESYTVALRDVNQTNTTVTQSFASGYTGVVIPNTGRVSVSSGYDYRYDINATNHKDNTATPGYTRYFATGGSDYNITLIWEPSTPKSGCNDTESKVQSFNLINGTVTADGNLSQVGEYRLNIIDTTWTAVDWDPLKQGHQTGAHFLSGAECSENSTDVPTQATVVTLNTTTLATNNLVGCNISSTHNNTEYPTTTDPYKYRDYLLTFFPYKFDLSGITFGLGRLPSGITAGGDGFVYMSDISDDDGMNMALRATGNIRAAGYNNAVTTNYVTDCYAKSLTLSMTSDNNLTHPQNAAFQLRFMDYNTTVASPANLIYDSNATNINTTALLMPLTSILDGNFTKETAGSLYTVSRFNYDRTVTQPLNPFEASFRKMNVKCLNAADCLMQADLSAVHEPKGERAMDFDVTYVYGRIIPRDVRVFGNVGFTANAWYEVFNTPTLAGTGLAPSRNSPQWFINALHNDNNDGDGNITRIQNNSNATVTTVNMGSAEVNGMETYTFGGIAPTYSGKAHINTDPWLWFGTNALNYGDPSNANLDCRTHPCFNINVVPNIGTAGSSTNTQILGSDKANKATSTGTGVTYDYTPATR
ncbi:MAG: hypothetical protein A2023_04025 [Sulfuricurvum sp. GWF2_44_89]|uniref:hypothetical protein n=1 Tax=unclassified Sulfuricurvum TaxID=2632390 RepID=UPI0008CD6B84|nr:MULTISPECIES: hypothetical protein [unclassified Sulfuricurvum]OHD77616.1 MAG: hypothetical protein A2023_04025 [Sulfuricurvum sp. GWF2_44_89]OHD93832.1 MAG: hypothetical protein A2517_02950 [Sulfuricurvum sp. RIFOXYD12_FULL_44_77]OHD98161.1 MAG: hypothetical protein A2552_08345 [Sulfuricurvum sp. RIFOXYD2_FULL_44_160]